VSYQQEVMASNGVRSWGNITRSTDKRTLQRVRNGILVGSGIATLLIAFAGGIDLMSDGQAIRHVGLTWWQLVVVYSIGGITGGALFGFGEVLSRRSPVLAFLVGVVACFPFSATYFICSAARSDGTRGGVIMASIGAIVLGGPIGLVIGGWVQND
jgi:hypothetical protein